ncbi:uncharacterized protein B0I36DRAFT_326637 [Microdochium trichocladiopsis]|uniref:Uncharacterized protein n=1 Tax=Microdochium trichocladiopsis TaxID=1682393 RepID=A0A9P8Y414_9PEZI|nr:uncharacterized protein B0I36DRAFT_326637 [Microdochium trichocladiopsis]KAH7027186.1 hypothetical protein B0I36DRAFT_326637 [Microdochium trichocladiopsis]
MASGLTETPGNVALGWSPAPEKCQYCNKGATREGNLCTRCTTPLTEFEQLDVATTTLDSESQQPEVGSTVLEYWKFFKEHGYLYIEDYIIGSFVDEIDKASLANEPEAYHRLKPRLNEYPWVKHILETCQPEPYQSSTFGRLPNSEYYAFDGRPGSGVVLAALINGSVWNIWDSSHKDKTKFWGDATGVVRFHEEDVGGTKVQVKLKDGGL